MTEAELKPIVGTVVTAKRLGWNVEDTWDNEIPWKDDGLDENVRGTLTILKFDGKFSALVGFEPVDPETIVVVD